MYSYVHLCLKLKCTFMVFFRKPNAVFGGIMNVILLPYFITLFVILPVCC